jgi:hypothetical protein
MTTTSDSRSAAGTDRAGEPPRFSVAGMFLEALARRDFTAMAHTLADTASLQALVPRGLKLWDSADLVAPAFAGWFDNLDDYELVEAVIGETGQRLHLSWRARVRGERLGDGWFVVEQDMYADTDPTGRLTDLRLLCSGYCPVTG